MNLCQFILLFIIVATLLLVIFVTKPGEVPKNNKQRWVRSLLTGISTTIIAISVIELFGAWMGFSQRTENCLKYIQNINIGFLACIGIPMIIVVTVANYFGYRQLIWLHSLREKIDRKKK